jgi:hypothetical protein
VTARRLAAPALAVLAAAPVWCAQSAAAPRQVTLYARPARVQYVDHSDDRARGNASNPFNADVKVPPKPTRKDAEGSRPGDNALWQLTLYRDRSLRSKVGTAVYSCTFNFDHQAICDGTFQLSGGTMSASGPVDFDAPSFTIAVVGGTGTYLGARGQVTSVTGKRSEQLEFVLP